MSNLSSPSLIIDEQNQFFKNKKKEDLNYLNSE